LTEQDKLIVWFNMSCLLVKLCCLQTLAYLQHPFCVASSPISDTVQPFRSRHLQSARSSTKFESSGFFVMTAENEITTHKSSIECQKCMNAVLRKTILKVCTLEKISQ